MKIDLSIIGVAFWVIGAFFIIACDYFLYNPQMVYEMTALRFSFYCAMGCFAIGYIFTVVGFGIEHLD